MRILLLAGSEQLAEEIARKVHDLTRRRWFRKAFPDAQLSRSKDKKTDFATTAGGEFFATTIMGHFTGRGGGLIIIDDPLDIGDASNIAKIEKINSTFDKKVVSRLDNQRRGRFLLIMHRLHDEDLSGHVLKKGWAHTVLPLIARRQTHYDLGHEIWVRRKGELLRPDAYTPKRIRELMEDTGDPHFELLYQQTPLGTSFQRLKREHFATFTVRPDAAVVLSVDPSLGGSGADASFNVIQAWCRRGDDYFMLDQWRQRCAYSELRERTSQLAAKYRPGAILIEQAGNGPALICDLRERRRWTVVEIVPRESKLARFKAVAGIFRAGRVSLFEYGAWRGEFVDELVGFPNAPTDDQADAAAQALSWLRDNPNVAKPPERGIAATANGGVVGPTTEVRGFVVARGRSITGAF